MRVMFPISIPTRTPISVSTLSPKGLPGRAGPGPARLNAPGIYPRLVMKLVLSSELDEDPFY